eukprot:scaffold3351_cov80-Cylindrotheca_fusiformis.AAC.3
MSISEQVTAQAPVTEALVAMKKETGEQQSVTLILKIWKWNIAWQRHVLEAVLTFLKVYEHDPKWNRPTNPVVTEEMIEELFVPTELVLSTTAQMPSKL